MIESIEFKNFKVLRDTKLPLSRFTLIVGPNGSGKTTAMQALQEMRMAWESVNTSNIKRIITVGIDPMSNPVSIAVNWGEPFRGVQTIKTWSMKQSEVTHQYYGGRRPNTSGLDRALAAIQVYSLDPQAIAGRTKLEPNMVLESSGASLAGVLDRLRDNAPERFELLNEELNRWLPEYDRILFDTPGTGLRSILLRTRKGHYRIPPVDLSQGTLVALALLTLAYIPDPPPIICIEEPDRGIHPRLLRNVQDALYRLSHPESGNEAREPIQVIATTHSPYLLDLYRDHPEEIVLAQKVGLEARFERLSDQDNIDEILEGARLGDLWYSGILGGVPAHP